LTRPDEALTGTKDARPEFQRLLTDCRAGLVDMVITKSVTRFARNTVTMLETVRELKMLGVDVFFQKLDGINDEKQDRIAKRVSMEQFVADLTACDAPLESFDEPLWYATVDTVTVSGTTAAFTFKDGTVIETNL